MDLKDFVKSSIDSINAAIKECETAKERKIRLDNTAEQRTIEFDVAVVASDKTEVSGGIGSGIKVLGMNILEGKAEGTSNTENTHTSRLKFGVYVPTTTHVEDATHRTQSFVVDPGSDDAY